MRVGAVQMSSRASVDANLLRCAELLREARAQGVGVAVLPENFCLMPARESQRLAAAEPDGKGPVQDFLARTARELGLWLVAGTQALRTDSADRVKAACLVFDQQGRRRARYDKIHLFDVALENGETYRESDHIDAGTVTDNLTCVTTPAGDCGLTVCYDLRVPELYRARAARGAVWFAVPSAFTASTGRAHWHTLLRARAIENLAYVVAPGQWGRHDNSRETYGHSAIIDPWGEVLAEAGSEPGVIVADIDLSAIDKARRMVPAIHHDRPFEAPAPVLDRPALRAAE